jgi:hypothetical protein
MAGIVAFAGNDTIRAVRLTLEEHLPRGIERDNDAAKIDRLPRPAETLSK